MSFKTYQVPDIGEVTIYKRRGTRSLRLTIRNDGSLRVSIPTWMAYAAGVEFAKSRAEWVKTHAKPSAKLLTQNQAIGKAHHLTFTASKTATKVSSRLVATEIHVTYPITSQSSDTAVQLVAKRAAIRALRRQAEELLPRRLAELAQQHNLTYKSVVIKQLKTRWGSCDQSKNIVLNLFLLQLPWELIDYVLLHELTHTVVMEHGPRFWQAMEQLEPKTPVLRKTIRDYRTVIN